MPRSRVPAPQHPGLADLVRALGTADPAGGARAFTDDATLRLMPFDRIMAGRPEIEALLRRVLDAAADLEVEPVGTDAGTAAFELRGTVTPTVAATVAGLVPLGAPARRVQTTARAVLEPAGAAIRSLTVWLDEDDLRAQLGLDEPAADQAENPPTAVNRQIIRLQQRLFAAAQAAGDLARIRQARRRKALTIGAVALGLLAAVAAVIGCVALAGPIGRLVKPVVPSPAPKVSRSAAPPAPSSPPAPPTSPPTIVRLSSTLLFAGNSAVLRPEARASIVAVGQEIRQHGRGAVVVTGYASDTGGHQDALQLSLDRAKAVADVLREVLAGTPVTVTHQGLGGANPVAPNDTEANRARNRRVEISYTG